VKVDFLLSGDYPGDKKPKPYAYPDPLEIAAEIDGIPYLNLQSWFGIKVACTMCAWWQTKHLAHIQAIIRTCKLGLDFARELHPYVRAKYQEIWVAMHRERAYRGLESVVVH
jgi:hypothetical protein